MSDPDITRELIRQVEELKNTVKRLEVDKALFHTINYDSNVRTLGASQNDYNVGNFDLVIIHSTPVPINITGIAGGIPGRTLYIANFDQTVTFVYNSGLSLAANRIITWSGVNLTIVSGQSALLFYSGAFWRIIFPTN